MTVVDPRDARWRRSGRTQRQLDLLDRLQALFLAEGFRGFTLDDLAASMHCSKTTLYALAPSKEQLARVVVQHYFAGAAARIERAVADIADPREWIVVYLAGIGEEMRDASARFVEDVSTFGPAREVYEHNTRTASQRIRDIIAEGVAGGVFHELHTEFLAETVGVIISAIQRGELGRRTGLSPAEAFTELSTLVLRALQPGPVSPRG